MTEDIQNKEAEIRKIWLEHKDTIPLGKIFANFLGDYFDITIPSPRLVKSGKAKVNRDWLFFMTLANRWKKEEKEKKVASDLKNLSDEDIEEVQDENRRRMILMLRGILNDYEDKPKLSKILDVGEIRRMYKAIQSLEEVKKRTEISRGKLKLDVVRTLLPYKRMSSEELLALKEKINESFDRVLKLKTGEPVGEPTSYNG